MSFDAVLINSMIMELRDRLLLSKIEKIQQPTKNTVVFSLNNRKESFKFLISANPGSARFNITKEKFDFPDTPYNFCMLLRKHLTGAIIEDIFQPAGERVVIIEFDNRDTFSDTTKTKLVLEMIGNCTNIIFTDDSYMIIDCVRRISADSGYHKAVQPGLYYDLPRSLKKLNFFTSEANTVYDCVSEIDKHSITEKTLTGMFLGLSPLLAREIIVRSEKKDNYEVGREIIKLRDECMNPELYNPVIININNTSLCYSLFPLFQYDGIATYTSFTSINELVDYYYTHSEISAILKSDGKAVLNKVKSAKARCERKLANQLIELKETDEKEDLMRRAQLITANIYRIKPGDSVLKCPDFYNDNEDVEISLNPLISAQKNAALLYKKYNKLKNAENYLKQAVPETKKQLDYLESVIQEISVIESRSDIDEIKEELISCGLIKNSVKKSKKKNKPKPSKIELNSGAVIYYGKNNLQNEEILKSYSDRNDLWFHIKNYHGSHVLLHSPECQHGNDDIEYAASLAAKLSECKSAAKVAVDYTYRKNVKKIPGELPGRVSYTDYSTIYVYGK